MTNENKDAGNDYRLETIGDRKENRESKYDEDLVRRANEETDAEIRKAKLEEKLKGKGKDKEAEREKGAEPLIYLPSEIDKENCLVLEGREHRSSTGLVYSYQDSAVEMTRCPLTKEVKSALQSLGFYDELLKRAGKDSSKNQNRIDSAVEETTKRNYLGYVNWQEALKLNLALGGFTLTLRQSDDLALDLIDAIEGKKQIRNLKGEYIPKDRLAALFDEIYKVRAPWRSEHLDANFKVIGKHLNVNYEHKIVNGEFKPNRVEKLEPCLMESRNSIIDFNDFLRNATYQGLPLANVKKGEFSYWVPANDSVAWLGADSGGADLDCGRGGAYADASLGVRRAQKIFKN